MYFNVKVEIGAKKGNTPIFAKQKNIVFKM